MSTLKRRWTSGPWYMDNSRDVYGGPMEDSCFVLAAEPSCIDDSDLRLVLAAPDLAEALIDLIAAVKNGDPIVGAEALAMARNAIDKAGWQE